MKIHLKSLILSAVAAFVLASVPAQAATIDFIYDWGLADAWGYLPGKVSKQIANPNQNYGYFYETFDVAGTGASAKNGKLFDPNAQVDVYFVDPDTTDAVTGGFALPYKLGDITIAEGSLGIQQRSTTNVAAAPLNDQTFFAYGPGKAALGAPGVPAVLAVNYAREIAKTPGFQIVYLGIYYGSMDDYNNISFYDGNHNLITGSGILSDGTVKGSEIIKELGGTPADYGSWFDGKANAYVNLYFDPSEKFTSFEFSTTGIAFEVDNILTGYVVTPEPATMLLLGLGLVGLAGARRRFKK